jgi:GNAT superfamily N-acetyltransferase
MTETQLRRAARNLADWHATSVGAFGCRSERWPGVWATDGDAPAIFLNAIVLPGAAPAREHVERLQAVFASRAAGRGLAIVDYRNDLDLHPLGLVPEPPRPCYWRLAGDDGGPHLPPELEILEVRNPAVLSEFEKVSAEGFEAQLPTGGWHPPAVLEDPRFRVWLGKVAGRPVGGAMAYVGDDVVGVYGVAVMPSARRHGYGAALTWQATRAQPDLPAALQPSDIAVGVYRRLGYVPIGEFTPWHSRAMIGG